MNLERFELEDQCLEVGRMKSSQWLLLQMSELGEVDYDWERYPDSVAWNGGTWEAKGAKG